MGLRQNRAFGFLLIAFHYVLAVFLAVRIYQASQSLDLVWSLFAADAAATLFIFLAGIHLFPTLVRTPMLLPARRRGH